MPEPKKNKIVHMGDPLYQYEQKPSTSQKAKIVRVKDADTFVALINGKEVDVRLASGDANEKNQASRVNTLAHAQKLLNQEVTLGMQGQDKYGRNLVSIGTKEIPDYGAYLANRGLAANSPYTQAAIDAGKGQYGGLDPRIASADTVVAPYTHRQFGMLAPGANPKPKAKAAAQAHVKSLSTSFPNIQTYEQYAAFQQRAASRYARNAALPPAVQSTAPAPVQQQRVNTPQNPQRQNTMAASRYAKTASGQMPAAAGKEQLLTGDQLKNTSYAGDPSVKAVKIVVGKRGTAYEYPVYDESNEAGKIKAEAFRRSYQQNAGEFQNEGLYYAGNNPNAARGVGGGTGARGAGAGVGGSSDNYPVNPVTPAGPTAWQDVNTWKPVGGKPIESEEQELARLRKQYPAEREGLASKIASTLVGDLYNAPRGLYNRYANTAEKNKALDRIATLEHNQTRKQYQAKMKNPKTGFWDYMTADNPDMIESHPGENAGLIGGFLTPGNSKLPWNKTSEAYKALGKVKGVLNPIEGASHGGSNATYLKYLNELAERGGSYAARTIKDVRAVANEGDVKGGVALLQGLVKEGKTGKQMVEAIKKMPGLTPLQKANLLKKAHTFVSRDAWMNMHEQGGLISRYEKGGSIPEYKKGSGIHIKKENRGKFTAYKKRTGKTTEEALHSKDPHVRKMANFARNAKKWNHGGKKKHEEGGTISRYARGGVVRKFWPGGRFDIGDNYLTNPMNTRPAANSIAPAGYWPNLNNTNQISNRLPGVNAPGYATSPLINLANTSAPSNFSGLKTPQVGNPNFAGPGLKGANISLPPAGAVLSSKPGFVAGRPIRTKPEWTNGYQGIGPVDPNAQTAGTPLGVSAFRKELPAQTAAPADITPGPDANKIMQFKPQRDKVGYAMDAAKMLMGLIPTKKAPDLKMQRQNQTIRPIGVNEQAYEAGKNELATGSRNSGRAMGSDLNTATLNRYAANAQYNQGVNQLNTHRAEALHQDTNRFYTDLNRQEEANTNIANQEAEYNNRLKQANQQAVSAGRQQMLNSGLQNIETRRATEASQANLINSQAAMGSVQLENQANQKAYDELDAQMQTMVHNSPEWIAANTKLKELYQKSQNTGARMAEVMKQMNYKVREQGGLIPRYAKGGLTYGERVGIENVKSSNRKEENALKQIHKLQQDILKIAAAAGVKKNRFITPVNSRFNR